MAINMTTNMITNMALKLLNSPCPTLPKCKGCEWCEGVEGE